MAFTGFDARLALQDLEAVDREALSHHASNLHASRRRPIVYEWELCGAIAAAAERQAGTCGDCSSDSDSAAVGRLVNLRSTPGAGGVVMCHNVRY